MIESMGLWAYWSHLLPMKMLFQVGLQPAPGLAIVNYSNLPEFVAQEILQNAVVIRKIILVFMIVSMVDLWWYSANLKINKYIRIKIFTDRLIYMQASMTDLYTCMLQIHVLTCSTCHRCLHVLLVIDAYMYYLSQMLKCITCVAFLSELSIFHIRQQVDR